MAKELDAVTRSRMLNLLAEMRRCDRDMFALNTRQTDLINEVWHIERTTAYRIGKRGEGWHKSYFFKSPSGDVVEDAEEEPRTIQ